MKLSRHFAAGAAAIALTTAFATVSTPVMAQQTTSDIRGTVTDDDGAALPGATVTVTDTRTGARRTIVTDANGGFSTRGLAVGGPYTVSASLEGFQSERLEGIRVSLSGSTVLSIDLAIASAGAVGDVIVVTSTRSNTAQLAIGPSASFGQAELEGFPSIDRDIRDIIRLDPRVIIDGTNDDNISCLGGNNRFNSFTIDGVRSADGFGLNASGFPNRNNLPIPFDAVEETAVEFAPFDVEYGQFTGCNINVVTKSGTNDFHGAAFAVFNNDTLTGKQIDGNTVSTGAFTDWNWGASLGGPIIKDRLWFFGAYEEVKDGGSVVDDGPLGAGFANELDFLTEAQANAIAATLQSSYGRDPLGFARLLPDDSRRILGRVDWQINDNHRLATTYTRLRELRQDPDDFGFSADFTYLDNFENEGTNAQTYSARLHSQWTDRVSTVIQVSRNDIEDIQGPVGGGEAQEGNPIPRIIIQNIMNGGSSGSVLSGPGQFRSANQLNVQIDQLKAKLDYALDDHIVTAGYELDQLDIFNLFAVNATGTITFNSVADFNAGLASDINGNGSFTGDIRDAGATFSRSIHSVYLQDEWQANEALTVLLGLRYDFYTSSDGPPANPVFMQRYGFSNTQAFDGLDVLLPRIGLTYDAGETLFGETEFRGGAGIFSGGDPTVWFSNAFSNFGGGLGFGTSGAAPCVAADLQVLNGGSFTGIPACIGAQQVAQATSNNGRVDATDPDFKIPSLTRLNAGLTHFTDFSGGGGGFFDEWTVQIDYIHSIRNNAPNFIDLTLTQTGATAPDGRPLFNAIDPLLPGCTATFAGIGMGFTGGDLSQGGLCDSGGDDQDILLTNVDEGWSSTASIALSKRWEYVLGSIPGAFNLNIGYAHTDSKDINPTVSSQSTSNFEEVALAVINSPVLSQSQFFSDHNFTLAARFEQEFIRDHPTSFSLFFNARSGRHFSYTYDNNTPTTLFGDSDNEERNLFYVPTGPSDPLVDFSGMSAAEQADFFAFLDSTGLSEFAGQISPRNAFRDPWFKDLDIRFAQSLPGFFSGHKALLFVDIENALNLISDNSNIFTQFDRGDVGEGVPVLDAACADTECSTGQYIYTNFNPGIADDLDVDDSVWAIQFGVRYEF